MMNHLAEEPWDVELHDLDDLLIFRNLALPFNSCNSYSEGRGMEEELERKANHIQVLSPGTFDPVAELR